MAKMSVSDDGMYKVATCDGIETLHQTYDDAILHMCNMPRPRVQSGISDLMGRAFQQSKVSGFWAGPRNAGEAIALMHSELSEALEAVRSNAMSEKIPGFSGLEEELADAIIRICDYAGGMGLYLPEAIEAKMAYNATRPKKHGKEF
jgi:NTP pyrophosphatase (non-canonical NTP hydrolase)